MSYKYGVFGWSLKPTFNKGNEVFHPDKTGVPERPFSYDNIRAVVRGMYRQGCKVDEICVIQDLKPDQVNFFINDIIL